MDERLRELFSDGEAWVVGGAVRDELLGRPVLDLDVACGEPRPAAHRFADRFGGAVFPLSERHGAWRVVQDGSSETVDFTPIGESIDADLATRDFTFNAIAEHVATGDTYDPYDGGDDLRAGIVRAVSDEVFVDDPLRLLRAVRFEDELGFRMDERTEALLRASSELVSQPAGERVLAELGRLSADGYRRLDEVGLLEPLGGSLDPRLDALDDSDFRLVVAFGDGLRRLPISNDLKRYAAALARARVPDDSSPRSIHRFRRATEPWATDALAYVGASELVGAVEAARRSAPTEPLVRGHELGLEPGPAVGRILEAIDEERAAGTISTREQALALARTLAAEEGS
jgi:Poly A polymerase head domain/Probable RNA and SrmB- binding site of polymerase A